MIGWLLKLDAKNEDQSLHEFAQFQYGQRYFVMLV